MTKQKTGREVVWDAMTRSLKACGPDYVLEHSRGMCAPHGETHESAVVAILTGLSDYVTAYQKRYGNEACVGKDGVLGDGWEQIARGLRCLLNGETGRLDCGAVDAAICDLYKAAGFEREL